MEYYLIIARSVTYAQRMQRALEKTGIRCRIDRAPRDLVESGCAYVVRVNGNDLAAALMILHREKLQPLSVFISRDGYYREVRA